MFYLESLRTLASCVWNVEIFGTLNRMLKLDNEFNSNAPSSTPQITKCGGWLIRAVYVFSLGGGSVS